MISEFTHFDEWFSVLLDLSDKNYDGLINKGNAELYREYFELGDTPEEVIDMEISYLKCDVM